MSVLLEARVAGGPAKGAKRRIGYLWDTPYKPCERHILRHVSCSRRFEQVVLTHETEVDPFRPPAGVVRIEQRRQFWTKVYRKYILGTPRWIYNQRVDALARSAEAHDVRLLHVFFGTRAINNLLALHLLKVPVTVSFHGRDVSECRNREELSRQLPALFELVSCVFVRSRHMAREVEQLGCPAPKLWVNWTGIPTDEFPWRARARPAGGRMVFLQISRLIEKKGLFDTLAAFDLVRRELPDAELRIGGEGELAEPLRAEIERRGLRSRVHLLGLLGPQQVLEELHGAHLFLHPSVTTRSGDREGIPNSLLEAMATGLPAVTTRHSGIPEAVTHGETGWLVGEGRAAEIAERMLWCARNPDAVERVGRAARRSVERRHSLASRAHRLDAKYEELMDSESPRSRQSLPTLLARMRDLPPG